MMPRPSFAEDVSALPTPPEERPRSVTFTFADAGNNRWNTRLVVVAADGTTRSSEVTHTLDGTAARISGNVGPDTVAVTTPSPDVMVMALSGQGVPYSMRVFTLGLDGNSQTETAVYFQPDGIPVIRETQLTRVE